MVTMHGVCFAVAWTLVTGSCLMAWAAPAPAPSTSDKGKAIKSICDDGNPWPRTGVEIRTSDSESKRALRLTRKEGQAIRRALQSRMRSPRNARQFPNRLARRLRRWRVGPLCVGSQGPQIGLFFVRLSFESRPELVLTHWLQVGHNHRFGMTARLRRVKGKWTVVGFDRIRAHRGRPR